MCKKFEFGENFSIRKNFEKIADKENVKLQKILYKIFNVRENFSIRKKFSS